METVGDARAFLSATREVARTKPVIVMKPGGPPRRQCGGVHTGSLTGSDEVLDAAFRAWCTPSGSRTSSTSRGPRQAAAAPRPRLTVLSNAGGRASSRPTRSSAGGKLAELAPDTMAALDAVLPPTWSHGNPVDIIGDAPPERYAAALEVVTRDPGSDGLLVILTPQAMTDPTRTAQQLVPYASGTGKPILASWWAGLEVEAGDRILREAGVATFPYPDSAAHLFTRLVRYGEDLKSLHETPAFPDERLGRASDIARGAHRRGSGRGPDDAVGARGKPSSARTACRSSRHARRRAWETPSLPRRRSAIPSSSSS